MNKPTFQKGGGEVGGMYGMAFLAAAFYYIQNAETFTEGLIGVIKAIIWPALLIYKLYVFLGM